MVNCNSNSHDGNSIVHNVTNSKVDTTLSAGTDRTVGAMKTHLGLLLAAADWEF